MSTHQPERADSGNTSPVGPEVIRPSCEVCDQIGGHIASFPDGHLIHLGCAPKRWRDGLLARDAFMTSVRTWALLGGASEI